MKYLYITGLEHSGTTLFTHLLSQHKGVIGLGEVSSFFSKNHMENYIEKWGKYSEAKLCSCGEYWEDCSFWGELYGLNGLQSNLSMIEKYRRLIN